MTMRHWEDEDSYAKARSAGNLKTLYDEDPIHDYVHWRIVANRFPHSRVADKSHILVLKRRATHKQITQAEWYEFWDIIDEVAPNYDVQLMNLPSMSSIKDIPHWHLYVLKPGYK